MQAARTAKNAAIVARQLRSEDRWTRARAGYSALDLVRQRVMPEYRLTNYGKSWFEDEEFFALYHSFNPNDDLTADSKFFLRELLKLVSPVEGNTVEAGVYQGASSAIICEARRHLDSTHWAFDSFSGLSDPGQNDGSYWQGGDLTTAEEAARRALAPYPAHVLRGWIPDVFAQAEIGSLAFAHVDVDLYEPTLASFEAFYPRLVSGAIIVCDDYGFSTCPGATRAVEEFMASRPEPVLHSPTGQGIVIKQ
jgi:O-methyltransferase